MNSQLLYVLKIIRINYLNMRVDKIKLVLFNREQSDYILIYRAL